jgi:hypothetical protein
MRFTVEGLLAATTTKKKQSFSERPLLFGSGEILLTFVSKQLLETAAINELQ